MTEPVTSRTIETSMAAVQAWARAVDAAEKAADCFPKGSFSRDGAEAVIAALYRAARQNGISLMEHSG